MSHPHASGFLGISLMDFRAFASAAAVNAPCVPVCVPQRPSLSLIAAVFSSSVSIHHIGDILTPKVAIITSKASISRLFTTNIPYSCGRFLANAHFPFPLLHKLITSSLMIHLLQLYTLPTP
jgi:hypothetical protein